MRSPVGRDKMIAVKIIGCAAAMLSVASLIFIYGIVVETISTVEHFGP